MRWIGWAVGVLGIIVIVSVQQNGNAAVTKAQREADAFIQGEQTKVDARMANLQQGTGKLEAKLAAARARSAKEAAEAEAAAAAKAEVAARIAATEKAIAEQETLLDAAADRQRDREAATAEAKAKLTRLQKEVALLTKMLPTVMEAH
jgi:chromosome segregation ATPase